MCLSSLVSSKSDDITYWNANSTNGELGLTVSINCLVYIRLLGFGQCREVWKSGSPAQTVQRMQYYPSGLPWADCMGADYQNRKYNGKEFIEMHGYDSYDYHARHMFPALMRFTTIDPLAEKKPWLTTYHFCSNNPVNRIDPTGMSDIDLDDIVISGNNNSSITIETSLINKTFSVDADLGGNHTIKDLSNVAIGYERGVNATGVALVGESGNVSLSSVMFLGGDYSGYWYDYLGGEMHTNVSTSAEASVGLQGSFFIGIASEEKYCNPKSFAGSHKGVNASISLKEVAAGVNFDGQVSLSDSKTQGKHNWTVISLGISAGVGPQQGFWSGGSITTGGHFGGLKLLTTPKPTRERSLLDKGINWIGHIL